MITLMFKVFWVIIWCSLIFAPHKQLHGEKPDFPTDNPIIYDICFTPYGQAIAIADGPNVKIFDYENKNLLNSFEGHSRQILSLSMTPDSTLLASGGRDSTAILWDMKSGELLHRFTDHSGIVTTVDICPNGKYLATGSSNNSVVLYDLTDYSVIARHDKHFDDVTVVKFNPNGQTMVSGSADGQLILYETMGGSIVEAYPEHTDWVRDIVFSKDGTCMMSAGDGPEIHTWRTDNLHFMELLDYERSGRSWKTSLDYLQEDYIYVWGNIRGRIVIESPIYRMTNHIGVPVHRVLSRPPENSLIELAVATRGRGVLILRGKDFKITNKP